MRYSRGHVIELDDGDSGTLVAVVVDRTWMGLGGEYFVTVYVLQHA